MRKWEVDSGGLPKETVFRYDQGDCFQEIEAGITNVEFVRGSGMGGGIGSILYSDRTSSGGPVEYFHYNAVGHTVATSDGAGNVHSSSLYEAYGNIVLSTGSSDNNRLANTKERDFSIGLDNHGFRYYDAEIGRYVSADPVGFQSYVNWYASVFNNPINHIDPLGLDPPKPEDDAEALLRQKRDNEKIAERHKAGKKPGKTPTGRPTAGQRAADPVGNAANAQQAQAGNRASMRSIERSEQAMESKLASTRGGSAQGAMKELGGVAEDGVAKGAEKKALESAGGTGAKVVREMEEAAAKEAGTITKVWRWISVKGKPVRVLVEEASKKLPVIKWIPGAIAVGSAVSQGDARGAAAEAISAADPTCLFDLIRAIGEYGGKDTGPVSPAKPGAFGRLTPPGSGPNPVTPWVTPPAQ